MNLATPVKSGVAPGAEGSTASTQKKGLLGELDFDDFDEEDFDEDDFHDEEGKWNGSVFGRMHTTL